LWVGFVFGLEVVNSCRYKGSNTNTSMNDIGPDISMVISGEVQTLRELSPSRARNPMFVSALFYAVDVLCVGIICSSNDPALGGLALKMGMGGLANFVDFVVIISVWSCGNAQATLILFQSAWLRLLPLHLFGTSCVGVIGPFCEPNHICFSTKQQNTRDIQKVLGRWCPDVLCALCLIYLVDTTLERD